VNGSVSREWAVEVVPIDSVAPHPRNYREHDVGAIAASIHRFGLYLPVLVQRSTGYIVAGSGRWKAQKALGATEIPVRYEDLTDAEAVAILVADNWIPTRGRNLDAELLELLQELREEEDLFEAAGVDDEDLEALYREVEEDAKPLKLDSRKMGPKPRKMTCPECGHTWEAKR
jgi:ParB-like chromosome segregation protein Spo0J